MNDLNVIDYKTVLVIGNGFDRNIGMDTSYSHFMNSNYFKDIKSKGSNDLINYLAYASSDNTRWVDIEQELGGYSQRILTLNFPTGVVKKKIPSEIRDSFRNDYVELCSTLKRYLKEESEKFKTKVIDDSVAIKLVHRMRDRDFYVINFNYTSFIETIIGNSFRSQIRYIHGTLKNNSDIVFGVEDSCDLLKEHIFLYKSHSQYKETFGLPLIFNSAKTMIFFGTSLGQTDHSYFDDFFKLQTKYGCTEKRLVFFYYGQDGYDDLIWQLRVLTGGRLSYLSQYNDVKFLDSSKEIDTNMIIGIFSR